MKIFSVPSLNKRAILWWLLIFTLVILQHGSLVQAAGDPPFQSLNTPPTAPDLIAVEESPSKGTESAHSLYLPILLRNNNVTGFLNIQDRQAVVAYYQEAYLNAPYPAINWTGNLNNCVPGTLAADFQAAVLARINFYRRLAGVPAEITFLTAFNTKAQAAALIMSRNRALNHYPPADWLCYSDLGYSGASSSNLALGVYGRMAIDLYMKDPGDGNGAVGHRRWILYPQTQNMGSGDIPPQPDYMPANALVVIDSHYRDSRPPTREEYVSWPPPGYMPYTLVQPRWSFSYAGAKFENATVSMKSMGQSVPVVKETVHVGYGENTLVWIPDNLSGWSTWPRPDTDRMYVVNIQNVLVNNVSTNFQYNVIVIDPDK